MSNRRITDLPVANLKESDSIRICNLYHDVIRLRDIPKITKECIIVIRDVDGMDYKSSVGELCEFIKGLL